MKWAKYQKELDYSYTLGIFPTIELLKRRPENVIEIILSSKAAGMGITKILELAKEIPVTVSDKQLNILSDRGDMHVAAIFNKYSSELNADQNHLLLYNPDDAGNLGTIMRSMLAFGFHDLALVDSQLDPLHPKSVRASMGACFAIQMKSFANLADYNAVFEHKLYGFAANAKQELSLLQPRKPFGLVFGNEGSGLPPEVLTGFTSVRIAQSQEVDSLNLANSVAIALYRLRSIEN